MKKFLLALMGIALMAGSVCAQPHHKMRAKHQDLYGKTYHHFSASLSPITVKTAMDLDSYYDDAVDLDMNGVSLGWTMGSRMMESQPLYMEVGADVMYAFARMGTTDVNEMNLDYLSVNVPVVLTWQVEVVPKVCIAPYLGLNLRGNVMGTAKVVEYDTYYGDESMSLDWFDKDEGDGNRFNVGLTFGTNFTFNKFVLGLGYTKDVTCLMSQTKIEYFTLSAGVRF